MKNKKSIIYFLLGGVVFGTVGVYAATTLLSQSVYYNNSTSGATSTNVQGAIDELSTIANTWIDPTPFGLQINTKKTIIAVPGGACIKRNGTVHCFEVNNFNNEKARLQQVFSDITCTEFSTVVDCHASDFRCSIASDGGLNFTDLSDGGNSRCIVQSTGSVTCD